MGGRARGAATLDVTPTPWTTARARLERAGTYWLATVRPDGRPHVVPVLAVVVDDLHFCASERSRKPGNLAADPRCVITAGSDTLDLVVEGEAAAISDEAMVGRVADAYAVKYGWHPDPVTAGRRR
jgi:nitroimidazol reductase NimA-like FMN-containing flavoprotein (pyridoxamine 5'-phosphate oxidase superfamily)